MPLQMQQNAGVAVVGTLGLGAWPRTRWPRRQRSRRRPSVAGEKMEPLKLRALTRALTLVKGVDAGLNKIGGRDPLRHRRSRASPLRRVYDRGSCACTRLCPE